MSEAGRREQLGVADIECVQGLVRAPTHAARSEAVATLRSWQRAALEAPAARVALRAAEVSYPWVPGVPDDLSELFVQLLWADPAVVEVSELERAYVFCAERGRRAIMRTLALRGDRAGLDAVMYLIGDEDTGASLPAPSRGLLLPLLEVEGVDRLAAGLVSVSLRRGWSEHAAEMITAMARRGLLGATRAEEVTTALLPVVHGLADACDRRCTPRALGTHRRGGTSIMDPARVDRRRLLALLEPLGVLRSAAASVGLRRALSCADPRVSATAAVGLITRGEIVGEDRLAVLSRSPLARSVLVDPLVGLGREFQLPSSVLTARAVAEAHLVAWLASATQLRCEPDEVEHRGVLPAHPEWGPGLLHVFAFRVNAPHWAAARDWMIAVVGPFDPCAELTPAPAPGFAVHSLYESEMTMGTVDHVAEITRSLHVGREDPLS